MNRPSLGAEMEPYPATVNERSYMAEIDGILGTASTGSGGVVAAVTVEDEEDLEPEEFPPPPPPPLPANPPPPAVVTQLTFDSEESFDVDGARDIKFPTPPPPMSSEDLNGTGDESDGSQRSGAAVTATFKASQVGLSIMSRPGIAELTKTVVYRIIFQRKIEFFQFFYLTQYS